MRKARFWLLVLVVCVHFLSDGFGSEALSTDDFDEIEVKVADLASKHGAANVLVVFDIDNTLLASTGDLGSDQWFSWQEELLQSNPKSPDLIFKSFPELLNAWGALLVIGKMRPTYTSKDGKKSTGHYVRNMQKSGVKVIALTSRGFEYEIPTLRAFKENGIDLRSSAIGPREGYPEIRRAYTQAGLSELGFSEDEKKKLGLEKTAAYVVYKDGVFFTAGMHKGGMLRLLLAQTAFEPTAIVFVDDREKHTSRVQDAFAASDIWVTSFRFGKEDARVEGFLKSRKRQSESINRWNALRKLASE
ncbi:MAG: DUF2608 domain-containing protein [Bdellovibrionaceae bacterium]|nr:DUF2608 domain-containing protein [Bdellovibrionales bacterium]MCB9253885.1 DUF2608 domain-containing protein [Pseudobdellovibrionaceae bacterium]